jgi:hypothetical protein
MAVARLYPPLPNRGVLAHGRTVFPRTPFESFCQKGEADPLIRPLGHAGCNFVGGAP